MDEVLGGIGVCWVEWMVALVRWSSSVPGSCRTVVPLPTQNKTHRGEDEVAAVRVRLDARLGRLLREEHLHGRGLCVACLCGVE